jgi:hypothetical protein
VQMLKPRDLLFGVLGPTPHFFQRIGKGRCLNESCGEYASSKAVNKELVAVQ